MSQDDREFPQTRRRSIQDGGGRRAGSGAHDRPRRPASRRPSCPIVGNESGSSPWSTAQITLIGAFHVPCKKRCTVATSQHRSIGRPASRSEVSRPHHTHRGASAVAASAISATGSAVATDQRSSPRETDPDTGRKGDPDGVGAGERDHATTQGRSFSPSSPGRRNRTAFRPPSGSGSPRCPR